MRGLKFCPDLLAVSQIAVLKMYSPHQGAEAVRSISPTALLYTPRTIDYLSMGNSSDYPATRC